MGLPKQRQVQVDWHGLYCLGSPSACATCSPACVIFYHVTGSCKGRITSSKLLLIAFFINEIFKAMPFKILQLKLVHCIFLFHPRLLQTNYLFKVTVSVKQLCTFTRQFREIFMRNKGQTSGCMANPYVCFYVI